MAVNKVVLGSETLLDLTGDTAKKISVAPTLTANSMFLSLGSTNKTNVFATDVILADSMDKINAGLVYTGAGTITALVEEKPSSDIVMNWWLRT